MKNPNVYFTVTDYTPSYLGVNTDHRYEVVRGDIAAMKRAKSGGDSIDGIAYMVGERYLMGRYLNCVVISFRLSNMDIALNLARDYREDMEDSVEAIVDMVTSRYPDTLIISTVARDVWKHGDAYEFLGTDVYVPIFERYEFRDISQKTLKDDNILHLTMVYVENLGGNAIVDNFEKFW